MCNLRTFVQTAAGYAPASLSGGLGASGTNVWLKQQLDANTLIVTATTTQIVANYALGLALLADHLQASEVVVSR